MMTLMWRKSLSGSFFFFKQKDGNEVCAVILSGRADVSFAGQEWRGVGGRATVFDGAGESVYAPPGGTLRVSGATEVCEVALGRAPATQGVDPALIRAPAGNG